MLNKSAAEAALQRAISTGGDFAEIFYEDTRKSRISQTDDKIDTATTARIHGAGLRVYNGLNSVYVHSNDTSAEGLMRLAGLAADAVGAQKKDVKVHLVGSVTPNIHEVKQLPMDVSNDKRAKLVGDACRAARAYSSEIAHVTSAQWDWEQHVTIANTEGMFKSDTRVYTRMMTQAIASKGGENQTGHVGPGGLCGFEIFETLVDPEQAGKEAAREAVTMLHADFCPAGVMPVIIDGGFGGVIFHEACGHSLEATSVSKGNSVFCNKLGRKIAADCVSAVDDGTMEGEWGTLHMDDEGTPTRRNLLIENGILKTYMIDRLGGRRMGMAPTGSSRRQDYTYAPTSRMTNTFICAGQDDPEEMIRTMGDGLYAAAMGGGSVNPLTGEFNFAVREGYWVKDGKIYCPVRGATLVGSGAQILMNIDRVGPEMWMAAGMCGSVSGSIPTNVGQPRIRVSSITVGGKGGAL